MLIAVVYYTERNIYIYADLKELGIIPERSDALNSRHRNLLIFIGTNSLIVPMCHKAVNQYMDGPVSSLHNLNATFMKVTSYR